MLQVVLYSRSQILNLRDKQQALKSDVEERLHRLKDLTTSIGISVNSSVENVNVETKRNQLEFFVQQQDKVVILPVKCQELQWIQKILRLDHFVFENRSRS